MKKLKTKEMEHRANLQTQVCPTHMEKQNCILALSWETKLRLTPCITLNTPHTWNIQFVLITKSKMLRKNQSALIAENHTPGKVISLHLLRAVRECLAGCSCESRTWESEEHRSGWDPDSLTATPHTTIPLMKTERQHMRRPPRDVLRIGFLWPEHLEQRRSPVTSED